VPGDRVSDVVADDGRQASSAVLAAASDRLHADGHADLAAAVRCVDAYLRDLAVAHTEIALVSGRVLDRVEALLGAAPTGLPSSTGRRTATAPEPRAG
jgi:hypothetical protein